MSALVTQTKIILPARRPELLTRQRLLDLLFDLLDFKLIILAAPAGYGKTSLLIDFIYQSDIPACWYSLDSLDKDPQRFLSHFIASITKRFPEFGERSIAMLGVLNQGQFDVDRVVATIVNDLYENIHEHFLIILDDYHLILGSEEIDSFINRFVQETGENCHLVLASRTLLPLPDMPLMVARGLVSGLSYEELAFNAAEIQSLAFQNYRMTLPTSVAVELAQETEGWITGLLLSTQRNWRGDLTQLRAARISGVDLYDYLAQQVLDQQTPRVRDFLMCTALLEEFNEDLCVEVFGDEKDTADLIQTISTKNLFILPVGEDGRWLRYHHLFSDYLQARMAREKPVERDRILHRLAQVYMHRGEYEKSYAIYKRLGDLESTAQLIARIGSIFLKSGWLLSLSTWLSEFPEEFMFTHPELNSLRGAVSVMQGRVDEGIYWLKQAEQIQRNNSDQNELAITLIRLSSTLRFLGMYEESIDKAVESLALIQANEEMKYPLAEGLRSMGISLYQIGRVDEAAEKLKEAYRIFKSLDDRQNVASVLLELGITSKIAGNYHEALSYYEEALAIWRETQNLVGQANLLNNLAVLHHIMGEHAKAGELYKEGLELATLSGYTRMQAYILCGIGDLYSDIGVVNAAKYAYERSGELANTSQEGFLQLYLQLKNARYARLAQNLKHAREILEETKTGLFNSSSLYEAGLWELEAGHLSSSVNNNDLASEHYRRACGLLKKAGQKMDAARAYIYLASSYHKIKNRRQAKNYLHEALTLSSELDTQHFLVTTGCENMDLLTTYSEHADLKAPVKELIRLINAFQEEIPSIRRQIRPHATAIQFVPPELSIHALGISQVKVNGDVVNANEWQSQRRVRELFFYILEHPVGLTKEEIGIVLWPDSSSSQMKLQFKNTLYRLRYALGQEVVILVGEHYFFNRSLDYIYDVDEFVKAMFRAHSYKDSTQKIQALKQAVAYYLGNYLADFDSTWLLSERQRLWKMFSDGILTLARLYLEAGDYQLALDYSHRLIKEDPCQEEAHQIAMRAYAVRGDRTAVIRQFESCRDSLMNEVNAKPSQQTNRLYESLIK